jgi:hypothetical protein
MPPWSQKNQGEIAPHGDGEPAIVVGDPAALASSSERVDIDPGALFPVDRLLSDAAAVVGATPLGSDCRKHDKRSVAASFDLNRDISLVDSHVAAVAEGAKTICSLE